VQTPGWTGGGTGGPDGVCHNDTKGDTGKGCDCGDGVSCGGYIFDHRNSSLLSWLTEEYIGGSEFGLGNPNVVSQLGASAPESTLLRLYAVALAPFPSPIPSLYSLSFAASRLRMDTFWTTAGPQRAPQRRPFRARRGALAPVRQSFKKLSPSCF